MSKLMQVVLYVVFAVFVGYLSASPAYQYADSSKTTVKLSLSHAANRVKPCVKLTPDQINQRATNKQKIDSCERARLPVTVELEVDGEVRFRQVAPPTGLWDDGAASIYERFEIESGVHAVTARLRDSSRENGWDYTHSETVTLEPGRYFTVTFRAETGGFDFR